MAKRSKVDGSIIRHGPKVNARITRELIASYAYQEVKDATFATGKMKAPEPDGYNSSFYRDNWSLTGAKVKVVVLSFLNTGKLLKVINTTTITLIFKKYLLE